MQGVFVFGSQKARLGTLGRIAPRGTNVLPKMQAVFVW